MSNSGIAIENGRLIIAAEFLAGLLALDREDLEFALGLPQDLVIELDARDAVDFAVGSTLNGTAALPALGLGPETRVTAECVADSGQSGPGYVFTFDCPAGWHFRDSFPTMPGDADHEPSPLQQLALDAGSSLVISSRDWGDDRRLRKGLNGVGHCRRGSLVDGLRTLIGTETPDGVDWVAWIVLTPVPRLRAKTEQRGIDLRHAAEYPWDEATPAPGIYLDLSLGVPRLPGIPRGAQAVPDDTLVLRLFSPLRDDWSSAARHSRPLAACLVTLETDAGRFRLTAAWVGGDQDEVIFSGGFEPAPGRSATGATELLTSGLPIGDQLPNGLNANALNCAAAHFHVLLDEGGASLAAMHLTLDLDLSTVQLWEAFAGLPEISLRQVSLVVLQPFSKAGMHWYATVRGGLTLGAVALDVTVAVPDLEITAVEAAPTSLDLEQLWTAFGLGGDIPRPPAIVLQGLSMTIAPGKYYSASLRIAPEQPWEIAGKNGTRGHVLPSAGIAISDRGWAFDASVDDDAEPIPVAALLDALGPGAPSALAEGLNDLAVRRIALNYLFEGSVWSLAFHGQLRLTAGAHGEDLLLDAVLVLESERNASDNPRSWHIGGVLRVFPSGARDPVEFDLEVDTAGNATTLAGSFRDPAGYPLRLRDLVSMFSANAAARLPEGLAIVLHKASLIVQAERDTETQAALAVDIGAGIDLGGIELPDLPLVGQPGPATIPALSLQVQIAAILAEQHPEVLVVPLREAGYDLPDKPSAGIMFGARLDSGADDCLGQIPWKPVSPASESGDGEGQSGHDRDAGDDIAWLPVQRSFGPLSVRRIGIAFDSEGEWQVSGVIDAAMSVAGLTISLDGLTVSSPLSPIKPRFSLHGLGVDYHDEAIEIGGALLQCEREFNGAPVTVFAGDAIVRAKEFTLSASGVYASIEGDPSLFLYAVLDYPLGGPAFFFVTGLAAGVGFNRALTLPTIDRVADFPLITMAYAGSPGHEDEPVQHDPMAALTTLQDVIPPAIAEYFVAVGVRFTSFKMIDSFALLAARFGHQLEVGLLGLSTLVHPPPEANSPTTMAEVQLALKATFIPEQGVLTVEALLTPASYFLSRDCHLSGGFAFYSWFKDQADKGARAGDFVATLGGYHPDFEAPAHYPKVPRLALTWQVNEHLSIKGSAYYAITAHAVMAGGSLNAVWQTTDVRAWFNAAADFLLSWQPYHYEARMQIALGAEVTIHFFGTHHLSFDASAQLHLWGPEFAGDADINLKVLGFTVSFHVAFGDHSVLPEAIRWEAFRQAFLPSSLCSAGAQRGLTRVIKPAQKTTEKLEAVDRWIVDPKNLAIAIESSVPLTHDRGQQKASDTRVGIAPMGVSSGEFCSWLSIRVFDAADNDKTEKFIFTAIAKQQPAALWGRPKIKDDYGKRFVLPPEVNAPGMIEHALSGYSMTVKAPVQPCASVSKTLGLAQEHVDTALDRRPCQLDPLVDPADRSTPADPVARDALLQGLGFAAEAIVATS